MRGIGWSGDSEIVLRGVALAQKLGQYVKRKEMLAFEVANADSAIDSVAAREQVELKRRELAYRGSPGAYFVTLIANW